MMLSTAPISPVATQRPMLTTPLAPRRRSPPLSDEALSSGPAFPNLLAVPPSLPDIIDMPTDGTSRRCSYSRGRKTVRGPPPTPTLRPRLSHFNPRNNTSSVVLGTAAAAAEPMPSPPQPRSSSSTLLAKTIPQKRRPSLVKARMISSTPRAA